MNVICTPIDGTSASIRWSNIMIRWRIGALIPHIHILPRFLILLHLPRPLPFGLLSQSQCDRFGHFPQMLMAIIQTSKKATVPETTLDSLAVPVDEVKAADLLLLASKPA
jgi:hypothetical protein